MAVTDRLSVVKPERIAFCLKKLREHTIHRHFAGYLCVRRTAAKEGRTSELNVDFREFYDTFLSAPGSKEGKPYIYAFIEEQPSEKNRWQNRNLAGSYAPSSIRPDQPFANVIKVTGSGRQARYTLLDKHWELARKHLAYGEKIPAVYTALVFYRDYALRVYPPSISAWVRVFQDEFGYLDDSGDPTEEFRHLYHDESEHESYEGWMDIIDAS